MRDFRRASNNHDSGRISLNVTGTLAKVILDKNGEKHIVKRALYVSNIQYLVSRLPIIGVHGINLLEWVFHTLNPYPPLYLKSAVVLGAFN
jgi:hypothetical protein